ncbi:MAG: hypothetical protein ACR2MM_11675 [Flavobacteriaceae bacterium]
MKTRIKYFILLVTLLSIAAIIYGFYTLEDQPLSANKFIGFGTVGLFLVAMPLFLFTAAKGKKVKDYMLTDENIKKMRGSQDKNPDNQ